ncbi:FadR family transcriptional regulator [Pseudoruegeria sp. M32A2M]|nr:FadR family transcriptional regulator [Pseudoruegeria sp. M32A2M]
MVARRAELEQSSILDARVHALSEAATRREFIAEDLGFYTAILGMTGNRVMHSLGDLVQTTLATVLAREVHARTSFRSPEALEQNASDHRAIVQAIADHDPERAYAAMEHVIRSAREDLAPKAPPPPLPSLADRQLPRRLFRQRPPPFIDDRLQFVLWPEFGSADCIETCRVPVEPGARQGASLLHRPCNGIDVAGFRVDVERRRIALHQREDFP